MPRSTAELYDPALHSEAMAVGRTEDLVLGYSGDLLSGPWGG